MEGVAICIKDHQAQHATVWRERNHKTRHKNNIFQIIIVFKGNNSNHKLKWTFTVITIMYN